MRSSELEFYRSSIDYILSVQNDDGSIPWEKEEKLDPWDHVEAAMALSIANRKEESERALLWLKDQQLEDGSWYSEYKDSIPTTKRRETNFTAYIATGLWHYYLIFEDKAFLKKMLPTLSQSVSFILSMQTEDGDIYWAAEEGKEILDDSLITASSSIFKSLECASAIYKKFNLPDQDIRSSMERLKHSLNNNPERYDRSWDSKSRYSMDWYYPIMCGVYNKEKSAKLIESKWSDFVVKGKGCKCVREEPWVTVAESSELVVALERIGFSHKAKELLDSLHQWRDQDDNLYWTGYVYTDKKFWPVEKPTWTAGAILIAADTVYKFTPGSELFLKNW